jgi:putative flippase GtrA
VIRKAMKFALVGGVNTLLDFVLFNFFAHFLELSLFGVPSVLTAQVISAAIVVPVSYALNRCFTFTSNRPHKETLWQYIGISFFNAWILQTAVIALVVHSAGALGVLGANAVLLDNFAKCCAIGVAMVSNFFFYHRIFERAEK